MKLEEKLLRRLIRESVRSDKNLQEFDIGKFFGSKKTGDDAVEAAKKLLDGHLSGKFEKSPEILKKAFEKLDQKDKKAYAAKLKSKHGSKNDVSDEEIEAAQNAAGNADSAKMMAKKK